MKIPVQLFDKTGKFIVNVGGFGKGPGEYSTSILCMQLDEDNNRIYLYPCFTDQIKIYDLQGNYLDLIQLPCRVVHCWFHVNSEEETVVVFAPALKNYKPSKMAGHNFSAPLYCAWIQKFTGEVIQNITSDLYGFDKINKSISAYGVYTRNNTKIPDVYFTANEAMTDSLYHYDAINNKLIPMFTVDFKNKEIPRHFYWELPNHYLCDTYEVQELIKGADVIINNFKIFIIDKTTLKGAYLKLFIDFCGNIELGIDRDLKFFFTNGYFILNWETAVLLEKLETVLEKNRISPEIRKKLTDLKYSIKETDNNCILYAKLKR